MWSEVAHPIGRITLISADSLRKSRRGGVLTPYAVTSLRAILSPITVPSRQ